MFHHFHGSNHLPSQGSLSASDFSDMLDWLENKYNLIGAREYLHKFETSNLADHDICLSFDDALLCQYDVALPILEQRRLDAFFFVYSSVFTGAPDNLEVFRYFRTNKFTNINDFYSQFFKLFETKTQEEIEQHRTRCVNLGYLGAWPIYTENDRLFRYLRNEILGVEEYEKLMVHFMTIKDFSSASVIDDLWMSKAHLIELSKLGHLVGLHSYTHPIQISKLTYQEQLLEYRKNLEHLKPIVGDIFCMSHPCGDYNEDTIKILDELGLRIGFRSNTAIKTIKSKFEIPREDHANIYNEMNL